MVNAIAPITPLIGTSPISIFQDRNVFVPLLVNNPRAQQVLENNAGNNGSNPDLFESELNSNRDVVVTLAAGDPAAQAELEKNDGNNLDNGTPAATDENDVQKNILNQPIRERLVAMINKEDWSTPVNDNATSLADGASRIANIDTKLSLEDVAVAQNSLNAAPVNIVLNNLGSNHLDVYRYTINALQGGLNEARPFIESDNSVEFEA